MNTKHTPAPWRAVDDSDGYRIEGNGNPSGTVAVILARRSVTGKADASLIAAAPDLLAALVAVVRIADRKTDEFDAARAAIAKATGEA